MRITFSLLLSLLFMLNINAQNDLVTYAGNDGKEAFQDAVQISDGTFLITGYADNLDWVDSNVPRTELDPLDINNALGSNRFGFILQLDQDLSEILHLVHFPQGAVDDIRFLKTTNRVGEITRELFISGNTEDTKANNGGYFIAKLNDNFLHGAVPDALVYARNVWAEGYAKTNHPWDVGSDGKVVYVRGQSHDYDWGAAHRLNPNGELEPVENWRIHWLQAGGEFYGTADELTNGIEDISHSGIVFKTAGRCELRSWTMEDYSLTQADENGGTKIGKWPLDAFFDAPCDPSDPSGSGPGYSGYRLGDTFVQGPSCVTIDRDNNHLYFGMNFKSKLPDGNPDFEPTVMAMDSTGALKWWSRLYHEITPAGDTVNSSPDQYIDALAIDYKDLDGKNVVVNARCHGNNVENLWEGNTLQNNPNANGFQNQFTGSSGNIHISWLGKLSVDNGQLNHSSYVAEYAEGASGLGSAHPEANLDNWPNPNTGWPTLNTTRLARNNMKVSADGNVCIIGTGRRTITTANAYQKMVLPADGGLSTWNSFVRVYEDDLSLPLYSSLVVGAWDTLTQQGGGNTVLTGIWKTEDGVIAVGYHQEDPDNEGFAKGNAIPTINAPDWGMDSPLGQSAILVKYAATNLENPADNATTEVVTTTEQSLPAVTIFPNPNNGFFQLKSDAFLKAKVDFWDVLGRPVFQEKMNGFQMELDQRNLSKGIYFISILTEEGERFVKKITLE